MTLQEAYNFFESLKTETTKGSEIKVYEKFLHILNELKNRAFSEDEIHSIATEIDGLNIKSNPINRKKYFKKALNQFENFLKREFSLTTAGHYAKLYGALGLSFGLLFGVAILSNLERSLGISLGLIGGMVVGYFVGQSKDAAVKAAGNLL